MSTTTPVVSQGPIQRDEKLSATSGTLEPRRMTDRKQVPADQRAAITAEIRRLLSLADARGKPVWSQGRLGAAANGISQETIRKANESPSGVGPAVRDGILKVSGVSMAELLHRHFDALLPTAKPHPARQPPLVTHEELSADDARWFAIRQLVELDGCTPDRAHEIAFSIPMPQGGSWDVYAAARRSLAVASAAERGLILHDQIRPTPAPVAKPRRGSRPKRAET